MPGLRDHVPEHWQTLLEARLPNARSVPRMERDKLSCAAWVAALDRSLATIDGPVILVAHSAGVLITAHWALEHHRAIRGALLATPPDLTRPLPAGYPAQEVLLANGWLPTPRARLPFPSIVAASTNDPLAETDERRFARKGMGQPAGRRRRGRPSQSRRGLRPVAARGGADRRALTTCVD